MYTSDFKVNVNLNLQLKATFIYFIYWSSKLDFSGGKSPVNVQLRSPAFWAVLTWPGGPQLDHGMGAPNFILSHALVDAFILGPYADHSQGPAGQSQALAGGEGHGIPQPQHRGRGVPTHLTGELGTLAPRDHKLGQLHGDLRGFCQETRAGVRKAEVFPSGTGQAGEGSVVRNGSLLPRDCR